MSANIKFSKGEDGIAVITLDNPKKFNSLTTPMVKSLTGLLAFCKHDSSVKGVIITGEGDNFCTGMDSNELLDHRNPNDTNLGNFLISYRNPDRDTRKERFDEHGRTLTELYEYVRTCSKPIVAALNGWTIGAGSAIACQCDLIVASPQARYKFPEITVGVNMAITMGYIVERMGSENSGKRMLGAEKFTAQEAQQEGLADIISENPLQHAHTVLQKAISEGSDAAAKYSLRTQRYLKNPSLPHLDYDIAFSIIDGKKKPVITIVNRAELEDRGLLAREMTDLINLISGAIKDPTSMSRENLQKILIDSSTACRIKSTERPGMEYR